MPRITQQYGITRPVPFIDVEVDEDNLLFLDPHAIRLSKGPQPFRDDAVACLDAFFQEIVSSIITGSPVSLGHGESLLQRFTEPWETRLGMSAAGFRGHGGSDEVGRWIWNAFTGNVGALIDVGVLRRLEHLPLYVEGIDRDITSDIATRIVFEPLAKFTSDVVARYPEFTAGSHRTGTVMRQVWRPGQHDWVEVPVTLPVVGDRELLLVPNGWARSTLLMSATRFYETTVLSFAQLEQAVRDDKGKLLKTPKDRLMRQAGLGRGRSTNLEVTLRAIRTEEDLVAAFEAFVAERLADEERRRGAA